MPGERKPSARRGDPARRVRYTSGESRTGKPVGVNFDPELVERVRELTAGQYRAFSDMVNYLVRLGLEAHEQRERDRAEGMRARLERDRGKR